jgi:preprotein translocase subunit SecA
MINKILTKIFGDKHEKDIKEIKPIVEEINRIYDELDSLSEDELKNKTNEFKERIQSSVESLEKEKQTLQEKLQNEDLEGSEIQDISDKLKDLDNAVFEKTQETLDEILPEAFAVVKQVCKRLKESGHTYTYAGQPARWEMIPYDVQLIGGIVIHQGRISEMATGEGKTLVAVAPIYLNALPEKGVHVVTVNDYLALRDADWMRPVYEYLGLTVGSLQGKMDNEDRKKIYNMDITYGTNNEFGFDYLRDNMVTDIDHRVQREHWFAIVDEVDSVLVDEARTPLIISGPVPQTDQKYGEMKPRVQRLVQAQNKYVNQIVMEAEQLLKSGKKEDREEAGVLLFRAHRGLPKHKRLTKLMQDGDLLNLKRETELFFLREQGRRMPEIDDELFYIIEEKNHTIDITEKGRNLISNNDEDPEMFVIPDIAAEMSAIDGDDSLNSEEKQLKKDQSHILFAGRSDTLHTIHQLLKAYSLFEIDNEYVVQNGKVMIVDEFTGRIMDGRRYSDGLHQAIEAKEGVKVERDTQTMATITLQNYFRLYHKLAGMTGTAETEAAEFEKIYELDVVVIPTNRPIVRDDQDDLIYKTKREKYNAIIVHIQELLEEGRAVLVGTASVEVSEVLSKLLHRKKIRHNVLNAKYHEKEAEIVAHAGKKGAVTIATNMAGRGTDIKLDPEVKKNGGLAIIGSERHESRRIDRQLRGRAGRQGDPGSSIFYISLEDNLMRLFQGDRIAKVMQTLKIPEGEPIQHSMMTKTVENAQKKVEENNFSMRKRLIDYDDVMNQQREVIYKRRSAALRGERLKGELFEYIHDMLDEFYDEYIETTDVDAFKYAVRSNLLSEIKLTKEEFNDLNKDEVIQRGLDGAKEFYKRKEEMLGVEFLARLERVAVLQTIDNKWKEHLRAMDDMKEGIHLRSYGQKDPLLEYKSEAFSLFVDLIKEINKEAVGFAFKFFPQIVERDSKGRVRSRSTVTSEDGLPKVQTTPVNPTRYQYEKSDSAPSYAQAQAPNTAQGGGGVPQQQQPEGDQASTVSNTFKRDDKKIGRNDKVKVRYNDGRVVEAKYKKVEKDVEGGQARII